MLILSRTSGESIRVGDIEIKILSLQPGQSKQRVSIGITAPRDVLITRTELKDDGSTKNKLLNQG